MVDEFDETEDRLPFLLLGVSKSSGVQEPDLYSVTASVYDKLVSIRFVLESIRRLCQPGLQLE